MKVSYVLKGKEEKVVAVFDTIREAIEALTKIPEADRVEPIYDEHTATNPFIREGLYE